MAGNMKVWMVATAVVLFPADCVVAIVPVGSVGVPENVGEASKTSFPVPVAPVGTAPSIVQCPEITGEVIVCTPVNVLAASVLAAVNAASGNVTVRAAVGPANVICCVNIGNVLAEFGNVTTTAVPATAAG